MTDRKLLSCPFCGGEAETLNQAPKGTGYSVGCHDDECRGFIALSWIYATEAEAIAAWNSRAEMSYEDVLILLDELGLSERTCNFVSSKGSDYPPVCSACGYELGIYDCAWYEDGTYGYERNYCPNCGAKVVFS